MSKLHKQPYMRKVLEPFSTLSHCTTVETPRSDNDLRKEEVDQANEALTREFQFHDWFNDVSDDIDAA